MFYLGFEEEKSEDRTFVLRNNHYIWKKVRGVEWIIKSLY